MVVVCSDSIFFCPALNRPSFTWQLPDVLGLPVTDVSPAKMAMSHIAGSSGRVESQNIWRTLGWVGAALNYWHMRVSFCYIPSFKWYFSFALVPCFEIQFIIIPSVHKYCVWNHKLKSVFFFFRTIASVFLLLSAFQNPNYFNGKRKIYFLKTISKYS